MLITTRVCVATAEAKSENFMSSSGLEATEQELDELDDHADDDAAEDDD
jgi:hypothetical protein